MCNIKFPLKGVLHFVFVSTFIWLCLRQSEGCQCCFVPCVAYKLIHLAFSLNLNGDKSSWLRWLPELSVELALWGINRSETERRIKLQLAGLTKFISSSLKAFSCYSSTTKSQFCSHPLHLKQRYYCVGLNVCNLILYSKLGCEHWGLNNVL